MKDWSVYIVECVDGSLYTGISNNVARRIKNHNLGKGAKYTRGRRPVKLKYEEKGLGKAEAGKREAEIKQMTREEKRKMVIE